MLLRKGPSSSCLLKFTAQSLHHIFHFVRRLAAENSGLQLQGIASKMYSPSYVDCQVLVLRCTEPQYHCCGAKRRLNRARELQIATFTVS